MSFYSFIRRAECMRIIDSICTSDGVSVEELIAQCPVVPSHIAMPEAFNRSDLMGKRVCANLLAGSNASDIFALRYLMRHSCAWYLPLLIFFHPLPVANRALGITNVLTCST